MNRVCSTCYPCAAGGEWQTSRVDEITNVILVARMSALHELPPIPGKDKHLDSMHQCEQQARKTARPPCQAGEIMPQLGIVRLHGIGLTLVGQGLMLAWIIDQRIVGRIGIRIILAGSRSGILQTPFP